MNPGLLRISAWLVIGSQILEIVLLPFTWSIDADSGAMLKMFDFSTAFLLSAMVVFPLIVLRGFFSDVLRWNGTRHALTLGIVVNCVAPFAMIPLYMKGEAWEATGALGLFALLFAAAVSMIISGIGLLRYDQEIFGLRMPFGLLVLILGVCMLSLPGWLLVIPLGIAVAVVMAMILFRGARHIESMAPASAGAET